MIGRSWLAFGLPSVLLLALVGRLSAFGHVPAEFGQAAALLGTDVLTPADRVYVMESVVVGVTIGIVGGLALTAWRAWRGRPEGSTFGDASLVRPRGVHELGWAAGAAVTAGLTEEAYFRLLLPLFVTTAFGEPVLAFAGSALLFGAAHRYQGWRGVVATTVAGVALTIGYLATGSLFAMMAVHAIGDLGHLLLRPALRAAIERRR